MPIKGIILILLIAIVVALLFHNEIYAEIKKLTNKKDEDEYDE